LDWYNGNCYNVGSVLCQNGSYCATQSSTTHNTNSASLVLSNGAIVIFNYTYPACNYSGTTTCGDLVIDTNGSKGPNIVGEDIFGMVITKTNGLVVYGSINDPWASVRNPAQCGIGTSGEGCAAYYLLGN